MVWIETPLLRPSSRSSSPRAHALLGIARKTAAAKKISKDIVDEAALVDALTSRKIAGAGLDCTVEEPLRSWRVTMDGERHGFDLRFQARFTRFINDYTGGR